MIQFFLMKDTRTAWRVMKNKRILIIRTVHTDSLVSRGVFMELQGALRQIHCCCLTTAVYCKSANGIVEL